MTNENTAVKLRRRGETVRWHGRALVYLRRDGALYLMLLLPVCYYILFHYVPIYGISIAFKDYNPFQGISGSEWVGLDVFREIFRMKEFPRAVRNTLLLNMMNLILGFPVPVLMAIMLNEVRQTRLKRTYQTLLYLPHFISWVIIGGLAYQLFSESYGSVNALIRKLGMEPVPFLTSNTHWVFTYFFTGVWQSAGWGAIVYLAAITGIDPQLYEAAVMDGCGRLRMIWSITLPSIKGTLVIMFILTVGKIMNISLDQPLVMSNVLVEEVSDVISTFVYRVGLQSGKFSVGTAVGLFQSVISLVMLLSANFITNRLGEEGIW